MGSLGFHKWTQFFDLCNKIIPFHSPSLMFYVFASGTCFPLLFKCILQHFLKHFRQIRAKDMRTCFQINLFLVILSK